MMFEKALKLPESVISSNNRCSNVLQITYELKIEAQVKGWHQNIVVNVPIEIGLVALKTTEKSDNGDNKISLLVYSRDDCSTPDISQFEMETPVVEPRKSFWSVSSAG